MFAGDLSYVSLEARAIIDSLTIIDALTSSCALEA
jgi:hypothetical protein